MSWVCPELIFLILLEMMMIKMEMGTTTRLRLRRGLVAPMERLTIQETVTTTMRTKNRLAEGGGARISLIEDAILPLASGATPASCGVLVTARHE